MNCTRVLTILSPSGPSPVAPINMAVRICLASSPPVRSFLSNYDSTLLKHCEPLRPCLSNVTMAPTMLSSSPMWMNRKKKKKKNVVFADSRGLALTAVHIFDEAEENLLTELQFQLTEIEGATAGLHLGDNTEAVDHGSVLVLDFVQPGTDYLDLRNRLKAQHVCLETCSIQDRLLSGTVKVQNLSFQKLVWVRITFDSWHSFQDVPCQYLNNVYGCPDTDTFSFSISMPEHRKLSSAVEFCIQYQTPDQTYWDNNQKRNYRLLLVDPNRSPSQSSVQSTALKIQREAAVEKREGVDFDPFGSPRTSVGIFPEWQSWGHVENSTPYW